jgi:excisionase family DNA binding protein
MQTLDDIDRRKASATSSVFLFQDELCELLGCSDRTLARWLQRGKVPMPVTGYPGKKLAWPRASTEAWVKRLALADVAEVENC